MLSYFHGVKDHVLMLGGIMAGNGIEKAYNLSEISKTAIGVLIAVAGAGVWYNKTQEHFDRLDKQVADMQEAQKNSQTRIDFNIDQIKDKQQAQLITLTEIKTTLQNQAENNLRKERMNTTSYKPKPQVTATLQKSGADPESTRLANVLPINPLPLAANEYSYYSQDTPYKHR